MVDGDTKVVLKRKVRNKSTELFEWHRCQCELLLDGILKIENLVESESNCSESEEESMNPSSEFQEPLSAQAVYIDVFTQLKGIRISKTNRARCKIYYLIYPSDGDGEPEKKFEELMASSTQHCQRWVQKLRRAKKTMSNSESDGHSSVHDASIYTEAPNESFDTSFDVSHNSISIDNANEECTGDISVSNDLESNHSHLKSSYPPTSAQEEDAVDEVSTSPSKDENQDLSTSMTTNNGDSETWPLPPDRFVDQLEQVRSHHRSHSSKVDSYDKHTASNSKSNRARLPTETYPHYASTSRAPKLRVSALSHSRRHHLSPCKSTTSTSDEISTTIRNLRRQRKAHGNFAEDEEVSDVSEDETQAELQVLRRVETTLRKLEDDNAALTKREHLLQQEVQQLKDEVRVGKAERKHLEAAKQHLVKEGQEWQHTAQETKKGMSQLKDELSIAREEAQLAHREARRLQLRNKQLLDNVRRLGTLVYGRF